MTTFLSPYETGMYGKVFPVIAQIQAGAFMGRQSKTQCVVTDSVVTDSVVTHVATMGLPGVKNPILRGAGLLVVCILLNQGVKADDLPTSQQTAAGINHAVQAELQLIEAEDRSFDAADENTLLRRLYFDLVGRPPRPSEITRFGLDPSTDKQEHLIDELLKSDDYGRNFTHYWRDSLFRRATNARANIAQAPFEEWMQSNLTENRPWSDIATELLTATGSVNENGATALLFAHEGEATEIAAEASRLFLGIQIQCANCHDHPWDQWKREQFHELVAFFPRVSVRRERDSSRLFDYEVASVNVDRSQRRGVSEFYAKRLDRNGDGYLTKQEAGQSPLKRLFEGQLKAVIDQDSDGRISLDELKNATPMPNRPGQGSMEHYMEALNQPGEKGKLMTPVFFLTGSEVEAASSRRPLSRNQSNRSQGISDLQRRSELAEMLTSNRWFAISVVNRYWAELTGVAFYTPVDDIGPDRSAEHEPALTLLTDGFSASGYDLKWLLKTIVATDVYRRQVNVDAEGFVRKEPQRLRSDQLYTAVCQSLNVTELPLGYTAGRSGPAYRTLDAGRRQFAAVFGFNPETSQDDLTGSIPESLLLMNSPEIHRLIDASRTDSVIRRISNQVLSDEDVIRELYLTLVSREPNAAELKRCSKHLTAAANQKEALEDIFWALLNSVEFQTRP